MKLSQALDSGKNIPHDDLENLALPRYGYKGDLHNARDLAEWLRQNPICDVEVYEMAVPVTSKKIRPEQAQFRKAVYEAYEGRCAVTGESAKPALEAAHIHGRSHELGHNQASDGILLRADLHNLYDREWMSIDKDGTICFCDKAGPYYAKWKGKKIRLPKRFCDRPAL